MPYDNMPPGERSAWANGYGEGKAETFAMMKGLVCPYTLLHAGICISTGSCKCKLKDFANALRQP